MEYDTLKQRLENMRQSATNTVNRIVNRTENVNDLESATHQMEGTAIDFSRGALEYKLRNFLSDPRKVVALIICILSCFGVCCAVFCFCMMIFFIMTYINYYQA